MSLTSIARPRKVIVHALHSPPTERSAVQGNGEDLMARGSALSMETSHVSLEALSSVMEASFGGLSVVHSDTDEI